MPILSSEKFFVEMSIKVVSSFLESKFVVFLDIRLDFLLTGDDCQVLK